MFNFGISCAAGIYSSFVSVFLTLKVTVPLDLHYMNFQVPRVQTSLLF